MATILDFARGVLRSSAGSKTVSSADTLVAEEVIASGGLRRVGPLGESLVDDGSIGELLARDLPARDWSNQELADLYRVKHILDKAGAGVEVDRGRSDEGDPWFVFCQEDGEVFVHLARLDGRYILDSPNIDEPLQGADFDQLIAAFLQRANLLRAKARSNVVSLRPGDGVLLHPAVMLTALIWSLYIASDELVGVAHAEDGASDHGGSGGSHKATGFSLADAVSAAQRIEAEMPEILLPAKAQTQQKAVSEQVAAAPVSVAYAASAPGAGGGPHAVAASLTAIAGAYGLDKLGLGPRPESEVGGFQSGRQVAFASESHQHQDEIPAERTADHSVADATFKAGHEAHVGLADLAAAADTIKISAKVTIAPASLVVASEDLTGQIAKRQDVSKGEAPADDKLRSHGDYDASLSPKETAASDRAVSHVAESHAAAGSVSQSGSSATAATGFSTSDSILATLTGSTTSSTLDGQTVLASVNVADIANLKLSGSYSGAFVHVGDLLKSGETEELRNGKVVAPDISTGDLGGGPLHPSTVAAFAMTNLPKFDSQARDFISFLLGGNHHVDFIATANEVLLIDLTAFDDAHDVSYARSWVFADNSIVSTVGHLEDFQAFGLA